MFGDKDTFLFQPGQEKRDFEMRLMKAIIKSKTCRSIGGLTLRAAYKTFLKKPTKS
jgi:hypothetical protein